VPAGSSSGVHPLLPFIFLPLLASSLSTVELPFNGLDLALLQLCVHSVIVPQYWALAGLDRARRGRRPFWNWRPPLLPAGWYRLVALTGLVFLLIDLARHPGRTRALVRPVRAQVPGDVGGHRGVILGHTGWSAGAVDLARGGRDGPGPARPTLGRAGSAAARLT
jgi:hypothetical protein